MSDPQNREVKYAKLHGTQCHVPGIGELGSILPHPGKTFQSFKMLKEGNELVLYITHQNVNYQLFIPLTNVQVASYVVDKKE